MPQEKNKTPLYGTPQFWRALFIAAAAAAVLFATLYFTAVAKPATTEEPPPSRAPEGRQPEEGNDGEEAALSAGLDVTAISLEGKKIILDPGHGRGVSGGTTGVSTGAAECDTNLAIAQKLKALLEGQGAAVVMTREAADALNTNWELDMQAREQIILAENADMFVSIHQNEIPGNPEASGPQVFYHKQGSVGKRLAVAIQEMMNAQLEPEQARMALDNEKLRILKTGTQPSCIVECGFMSNAEEDELLQTDEYQQKVAQSICDGVKLYVKRFP